MQTDPNVMQAERLDRGFHDHLRAAKGKPGLGNGVGDIA